VVCQERHAAEAGRQILRAGGNAVDSAIATAFALAVTHPAAGNIGGGGFLVAYLANADRIITIDFRETAPSAAHDRMYLDPQGKLLPNHRIGAWAAGVPGTVRGLALAHARYARLPWKSLLEPAIALARDGFPISARLARSLNEQLKRSGAENAAHTDETGRLADFPESIATYGKPDGTSWNAGDRLVLPELAATLERIALSGPDDFYSGLTARLIVDHCQRNGGLISLDDLREYRAIERPPISFSFRGYSINSMGPPSSGGIILAQSLQILEHFDLKADGPAHPRTIHRAAEALKRAFLTRATLVADPDRIPIDLATLTSARWAAQAAASLADRATPSQRLADFPIGEPLEHPDTTHLSVLDRSGNAVALTYTLEENYGSKSVVPKAGFLLNNEMGDFHLTPGRTDRTGRLGTLANRIEPGKRMLSSQTPTIVLRNGQLVMITGSPGGRTIPSTVLCILLNRLAFELDPAQSVAAPRFHHGWLPDLLALEGDSWSETTRSELVRRGHALSRAQVQGDAHTIFIDPISRIIQGIADPRSGAAAAAGD
jgi:gamma-glutamyltranspeptidase/glutathione hydrolase